jgi:hypothetical protein
MVNNLLNAALKYHDLGWSVIPLSPNSKIPPKDFKVMQYRERLSTKEEIEGWWKENPKYNVGIVTGKLSNLFVVDLDKYKPEYSEETVLKYIPDNIETAIDKSPRGGEHLYFQYPKDCDLTIHADILPAVDYRGENGYILAPPSIIEGKASSWIIPPNGKPLAQVPDAYLLYIKNNIIYGNVTKKETAVTNCYINLNQGSRDQTLFHVANLLIKGGAKKEETLFILKLLAKQCNPPFPESEIVTKCNSAVDRAERKERNISKELDGYIAVTNGYFSVTDCYMALQVVTKEDKTSVRVALSRLKDKVIEKHGQKDGVYKRIETDFDFINFDENEVPEVEYPVKLPLGLNDIAEVSQGNIILVAGEFNAGKGHPDGTLLMTPFGWKPIEKISVGDSLYSETGKEIKVDGVFPRGEQKCYRFIFNDGSSIETDRDHIWSVMTQYNKTHKRTGHNNKNINFGKYTNRTTNELISMCGLGEIASNKRFALPQLSPIEYPEKELKLDPYLLGVLLGDGGLSSASTIISSADSEILNEFKKLGFTLNYSSKYDYRIIGMASIINDLGLKGLKSNNKFIPNEYLLNSVKNRVALLSGLLDTDGYVSRHRAAIEFTSISRELANGVVFLVRSLGGRAVLSEKETNFTYKGGKRYGQKAYRVSIKINNLCPFRLPRKIHEYRVGLKRDVKIIRRIDYVGEKNTTCIKVSNPTGLYVAQDFIITHNTSFLLNVLKDNKGKLPIRYITSEMSKSEFKKRFASFAIPLNFWKQDSMTDYIKKSSDFHTVIKPEALNIIDYMEFRDSDYTKGAEYLTQIHDKLTTGIAIVAVQKKEGQRMPRSGDMIVEKPRLAISFSKSIMGNEYPQGSCEILKCKMPKLGKIDGKKLRFEIQQHGSKFHILNDWGYWKF